MSRRFNSDRDWSSAAILLSVKRKRLSSEMDFLILAYFSKAARNSSGPSSRNIMLLWTVPSFIM